MKKWVAMVLLSLVLAPLSANFLQWDPAGTNAGELGGLNIAQSDSSPAPLPANYQNGEYWTKDGFLGRLVYQGDSGNVLTFTNSGSSASGSGSGNYFYYIKTNSTSRWRRVFMVGTVKALRHESGGELTLQQSPTQTNAIIQSPGDTLTIPAGAGGETVSTSSPGYQGGYNRFGTWGSGPGYIYKYPYEYIWIDLTVIRMTNTLNINRGGYICQVQISGEGLSMHLDLSGYSNSSSLSPDTYVFELERAVPEFFAFQDLVTKNTYNDSFLVGYVRYRSVDGPARIFFAANPEGTSVDFRFTSIRGSFPYNVVYTPQTPSGSPTGIYSTSQRFPSVTTPIQFTSPIYGETRDVYALDGEVRIYVSAGLGSQFLPAEAYSSKIYCFLVSY